MKDIIYAPIMIPTLCRDNHFVRCIESLKKNLWASKTDVYIALDFPAKEEHKAGYEKICNYLKGDFTMFASFNVFKREMNYGASKNSREMAEWILQHYDRYIRTDDDVEFSPNFLEFMDRCLHEYEDDPDVIAVSGYSYPIKWKVSEGSTVLKLNCVCSMWGTGFWREKRKVVQSKLNSDFLYRESRKACWDGRVDGLIDARKENYSGIFSADKNSYMRGMSDIAIGTYCGIAHKWVVVPVISKARNWGFDGTGECCQQICALSEGMESARNYDYTSQPIDTSENFDFQADIFEDWEENAKRLNKFDSRTKEEMRSVNAKITICKNGGGSFFVS